jgi:DNA-binding CsgD family transcriptional regulator
VRTSDLTRVLDTVAAMNSDLDRSFERTMLAAARRLLDCDTVSYNEHRLDDTRELVCYAEPSYVERSPARSHYLRLLAQHPPIAACATGRAGGGDTVAVSDLAPRREFRELAIYRDYFRPRGVEDQLVAVVRARHARSVLVVFSRSRVGFSERDRSLVSMLLPHVQHAVRLRRRLAVLHPPRSLGEGVWAGLTGRERDVVTCLASGATDQRIARTLLISPRTVGKHLENVYRKTGVSGRTALVAAAGATAGQRDS